MLADVLESKRDQVEHDLEYLEANTEWSGLPISIDESAWTRSSGI